ncbi:MAG TPA: MFS transporter, partial [Dehalococcoidia bacterium]|nr:MFS transporter [Dehalococcoidia bacterium]
MLLERTEAPGEHPAGVAIVRSATPAPEDGRARSILLLLAASVALLMTGYGIVLPVFGKRLPELGGGVDALGFLTMAFAVGQTLFAPISGSFGDRFGRRPVVLVSLSGIILANAAFLVARDVPVYVAIRFVEGAITAGLLPASMAIVGDLVPEHRRAKWAGIIMSSYGAGFIFGPAAGGLLYDAFGFAAPFVASAGMGLAALLFALVKLPETRPVRVAPVAAAAEGRAGRIGSLWASLPRPIYVLAMLLYFDFVGMFAFAFVEPPLVFHIYGTLGYSTTHFGLIISAYGLAMVVGQALLGGLSDRFARKLAIASGFLLCVPFYLVFILTDQFAPMI